VFKEKEKVDKMKKRKNWIPDSALVRISYDDPKSAFEIAMEQRDYWKNRYYKKK